MKGIMGTSSVDASLWVPDDMAPNCCVCKAEFAIYRRRHHCRCACTETVPARAHVCAACLLAAALLAAFPPRRSSIGACLAIWFVCTRWI